MWDTQELKIEEKQNWKILVHDPTSKLNRATVLAKQRLLVNSGILRFAYFTIFDSHLNYKNKNN